MTFLQGSGEGDKCALVKDTHPPGGQSHCPGDRIHQEPSLGRVHGRGVEVTRETRPRPSVSRQQQQQPQPHVGGTTPPAGHQSALVRGGHVFPSPPALTSPWREMRFQLSAPSEKAGSVLPADPAQQADAKRPRVSTRRRSPPPGLPRGPPRHTCHQETLSSLGLAECLGRQGRPGTAGSSFILFFSEPFTL